MIFSKQILFTAFLLYAIDTAAQEKTGIEASVDKKKILIGEPFTLRVRAQFAQDIPGRFILIDSIEHFEFVEEPLVDSAGANGSGSYSGIYKLTSFDSGHWVIPSFQISKQVKTDTIGIDVIFSEFNPDQEYHDIKDIIEVKPERKKTWWWYAAGGAVLLGLLLVYLSKRKKPVPVVTPVVVVNPYEEAIQQLSELQKSKPGAKQYHTRLAEIFRLYIFRRKGILSLQKTTEDLILQLKDLKISNEQSDRLSQSLRMGDFVKFAKYNPAAEDDMSCLKEIGNSITAIEKTEDKNAGQEN